MTQASLHQLHVILGTGPVGCWIARALRTQGLRVNAVNRSGHRPDLMPIDVPIQSTDLSDVKQATDATTGASVIYQALSPPYHLWHRHFPLLQRAALSAASVHGARYVSIENLYMYDATAPINEATAFSPCSRKGMLRADMAQQVLLAHERGDVRTAALRSSDYYGPGVTLSTMGKMVFGNLVKGRKAQLNGSATMPHSFAYIEDVGVAAAILGTHEQTSGSAWMTPHAPAQTQGDMVAEACRVLGIEPRLSVISPLMMRLAGIFLPDARASVEMMYQFTRPFVVDSRRMERKFGLTATPVDLAIARTLRWYSDMFANDG